MAHRKKSDLPTKICPVCERPFQLARTLEASVGPDCLLLKAMQWPTRAQARGGGNSRSFLERFYLLQGLVRPPQHRLTVVITRAFSNHPVSAPCEGFDSGVAL